MAASLERIGFGDARQSAQNPATINSLPGQKLKAWVSFNAPPAPTDWNSKNAWLDIHYGGSADPNLGNVAVQGPTNTAITEQLCINQTFDSGQCYWGSEQARDFDYFSFQIAVGACSKAENPNGCQATVKVSSNQALGSQLGVLNVIPQ